MTLIKSPPPELMSKTRYLVWGYREIDGKERKVPYNPRTGAAADGTTFKDCTSYAEAYRA